MKLLGGSFPCDRHADKLTIGVLARVDPLLALFLCHVRELIVACFVH